MKPLSLHPDRLFSAEADQRAIARRLYQTVENQPIVSPHGHTDPAWFARDEAFSDPASLLVTPDHYLFRMLFSQGVSLESLGLPRLDGGPSELNPRKIWQVFADHYHLFLGTPSRIWLDHTFHSVFGIDRVLGSGSAMEIYDTIDDQLARPEFAPRALFERFNIEFLATTEAALDPLAEHDLIQASGWSGRVATTYRPDAVVDPENEDFSEGVLMLGELTGEDTSTWAGYLAAHRLRRQYFKARGAVATDHGHPSARTENFSVTKCQQLLEGALQGKLSREQSDQFRGQVLTEMAQMSLDDGLVMQIHAGVVRNHHQSIMTQFGRDRGADLPAPVNFVTGLRPMLDRLGHEAGLTVILFTLDESSYSRDLGPLAGHYPCLRLGPPWWFFNSVEGMLRHKRSVLETAGFYNTCGFNDDTRAFLSIPARHDVARRIDCRHLAELIAEHRLSEDDGVELARLLAVDLARDAYGLASSST